MTVVKYRFNIKFSNAANNKIGGSRKDHNFRRVDTEDAPKVESGRSQESPSVPFKTSGLVKAPLSESRVNAVRLPKAPLSRCAIVRDIGERVTESQASRFSQHAIIPLLVMGVLEQNKAWMLM
ncbi:hypothetical protein BDR04DRAFT_1120965 [Suillus decipiens]|nr:hypothetical protein BDR04DRAFT_1120965 [Suillus decipiens]